MKLMTHVVVGYPTLADTGTLVKAMARYASFIELQIPFSDPLADGPTIMHACEMSLKNGTKVADAFSIATQLTQEISVPILFMCYYNTVLNYGVERFVRSAKKARVAGLIVPDMPLEEEEHEHFYAYCKQYDMPVIFVVSPVTSDKRLQQLASHAKLFVYATARQGITGARKELDSRTIAFLARVKKFFSIPVAVGFGISTPEHVRALRGKADIAVVGSALIEVVNRKERVGDFLSSVILGKNEERTPESLR